jgi:hypothetical protein
VRGIEVDHAGGKSGPNKPRVVCTHHAHTDNRQLQAGFPQSAPDQGLRRGFFLFLRGDGNGEQCTRCTKG